MVEIALMDLDRQAHKLVLQVLQEPAHTVVNQPLTANQELTRTVFLDNQVLIQIKDNLEVQVTHRKTEVTLLINPLVIQTKDLANLPSDEEICPSWL